MLIDELPESFRRLVSVRFGRQMGSRAFRASEACHFTKEFLDEGP